MSTFDFSSWGITPSGHGDHPVGIGDNIDRLYLNAVGRHADPDGKKYWKEKIASGTDTYQTLMDALMGSKEFSGRSDAKKANPNVTEAQLDAMNFEGNFDYNNRNLFDTPGSAAHTYVQAGGGRITPLVAAELVADAANSTDDITIGDNVISGSRDIKRLAGGIYGGSNVPTINPEVESTDASLTQDFSMDKGLRHNLMQNQGWSFDGKEGLGINDINSFARTNHLTDQLKAAAGDDGILDRFEFESALTSNRPDNYAYNQGLITNALANYWATTGADIDEGILKQSGLSKSGDNLIQTVQNSGGNYGPNLSLSDYVKFDQRTPDGDEFIDSYTWSRNPASLEDPEKEFAEFKSNISKEEAEAIYGPGIDEVYNYVFGTTGGMSGAGKEHYLKDLVENRAGLTQGQNWKVWLDKAFRNTEDYKLKEAGEGPTHVTFNKGDDVTILPGIGGDDTITGGVDYAALLNEAMAGWNVGFNNTFNSLQNVYSGQFDTLSNAYNTLGGQFDTLSNKYDTLSSDLTQELNDLGVEFTTGLSTLGTDLTNLGGTYSDNISDLQTYYTDKLSESNTQNQNMMKGFQDSNKELMEGYQESTNKLLKSYQDQAASFQSAQNAQAAYGERNRNPTVKGVRTQNELPGFKPKTGGTGFFGRGSNRLTTSSLNI
tara:strand:+ start:183 stop:2162 length:1980 start_codon:yes stop_codon:yes gene_type:complete